MRDISSRSPSISLTWEKRSVRWLGASVVLLVFATYLYAFTRTVADPDLWGHVIFGRDTVAAGSVVRTDVYSYLSEPGTWINHELLAEVSMWLAYDALGPAGLILLKSAIIVLVLLALLLYLVRRNVPLTDSAVLLAFVALALNPQLNQVRPQLYTLMFFTVTVVVIARAEHDGTSKLWWLVPIFALWINFHGGVLAGIALLGVWLAIRVLQVFLAKENTARERFSATLKLATPALAAVLATLITPFGPRLMLFLLRTATVPRPEIRDWQPVEIASNLGIIYLVILSAACAGLLHSRRQRSPALLAVYAACAILPLMAIRHLPLFGIAVVVLAGEHISDSLSQLSEIRRTKRYSSTPRRLSPALAVVTLLMTVILSAFAVLNIGRIPLPPETYPTRAIAFLKAHVPAGNLAIHFNWGEYAIWHLGPDIQVSLDGRRETVYSNEVYADNYNFMVGRDDWDALLTEYATDLVLVRKTDASYNLMRLSPGWISVYDDPMCALFIPEHSPLRPDLENASVPDIPWDGTDMVFPGPDTRN